MGDITSAAKTRGATRYSTGEIAIDRRASICSVTFMEPISAVIAEPARADSTTPTRIGPVSRKIESATIPPIRFDAPKVLSVLTE